MIFKENNKAIFMQIADRMCDKILTGTLQPQSRVPSVRAYAAEIEVNANTVMRAYDHMSAKGYLYNKRGIGYFVTDDAPDKIRADRRNSLIGTELTDMFEQLRMLGITPNELQSMYSKHLQKK